MSDSKKFVTENHVSSVKQKEVERSIQARISILSEYLSTEIPDGFIAHQSNQKMVDWHNPDLKVTKISLNAAKKQESLWKELVNLRRSLKERTKDQAIQQAPFRQEEASRESRSKIRDRNRQLTLEVKSLTNELVTLRVAYLELINRLEERDIKDSVLREAIQRHKDHHGLKVILGKGQRC